MDVQKEIVEMCDSIAKMLVEKNRKYGNSALEPLRVFSKADLLETIRVRMDDKLCRIRNEQADDDEDAYMDLAGYLVLYMIARKREKESHVTLEQAKPGLLPSTISVTVDHKAQLALGKFRGDLAVAAKAGKATGLACLETMSEESLDCLLCQAQESGDYSLIHDAQAELDRRGRMKSNPDGCGIDDASLTPTT